MSLMPKLSPSFFFVSVALLLLQACSTAPSQTEMEIILDSQNALLKKQKNEVLTSDPDKTNLFFVGISADYNQPEMYKETIAAKALFDDKYGTQGRSVLLINHNDTVEEIPIASQRNIGKVFKNVGSKMNKEEDVLFVYLTAHGYWGGQFMINFGPEKNTVLNNKRLKHYLDKSGAKWKVIVINSCYSGGFIDDLIDPYTLVITSTSDERLAYYNKEPWNYSYFGQSFFAEELSPEKPIEEAFELAKVAISRLESNIKKGEESQPQFIYGNEIMDKLKEVNLN